MKRFLLICLFVMLCMPGAMAESVFDTAELQRTENTYTFTHPGTVDTVVRLENQPYWGEVDEIWDGGLCAYVDYVIKPDYDATLIRLFIAAEAFGPIAADELRLTVGSKCYTFAVTYEQSEYDGLYMEDYVVCLTDASLQLLKAIAQQKKDDPIPVELLSLGDVVFSGRVIIPGDDAALLYDRYINLGGKKQNLKKLDEVWPCKVEKVK